MSDTVWGPSVLKWPIYLLITIDCNSIEFHDVLKFLGLECSIQMKRVINESFGFTFRYMHV